MSNSANRVGIVIDQRVDRELLCSLSLEMHVWLLASKSNREIAQELFELNNFTAEGYLQNKGITVFDGPGRHCTSDEILFDVLKDIDEHHNPGWIEAYVYGVSCSDRVKSAFNVYGFTHFELPDDHYFIVST